MAEIVLFHHAQGLTPGVLAWAERWRAAGHVVHTPDLYEGKTYATLDAGMAQSGRSGSRPCSRRAPRPSRDCPASSSTPASRSG